MEKKILYIIPNLNVGGAEKLLLTICNGIVKKDSCIKLEVLTLTEPGILAAEFRKEGIPVTSLNNKKADFFGNFLGVLMHLWRTKPLVVHTHLWMADKCGLIAALLVGVKHRIFTIHCFEPRLTLNEKFWNKCNSIFANTIISVGNAIAEQWVTARNFPSRKMKVIQNAPSLIPKAHRFTHPQKGKLKILHIGRIDEQKGQLFLIESMLSIFKNFPEATLDIFGPCYNSYDKILADRIRRLGLETKVFLKGPTQDSFATMTMYDIIVLPSLWEGVPILSIEALGVGIPIIATDIPSHREVFDNNNYAVLVPTSDPEAIAKAVFGLMNDPELYNKLSENGPKRAAFFSAEKMIDSYHDLYSGLFSE